MGYVREVQQRPGCMATGYGLCTGGPADTWMHGNWVYGLRTGDWVMYSMYTTIFAKHVQSSHQTLPSCAEVGWPARLEEEMVLLFLSYWDITLEYRDDYTG